MSTKNSRSGGKYGGTHTTVLGAAAIIADIAERRDEVTKIVPGYIKPGLRPASRRVKISNGSSGNLLLGVRDSASHQEVRVYTNNPQATKLAIARGARDAGLYISFGPS